MCNWELRLSTCFEACGLWTVEYRCFWLGIGGKIRVHHNMPSGSFGRKSPVSLYPRSSDLATFGLCEESLLRVAKQWSPALDSPHSGHCGYENPQHASEHADRNRVSSGYCPVSGDSHSDLLWGRRKWKGLRCFPFWWCKTDVSITNKTFDEIFYEITNRCSYMQSILFHC